MGHIDNQGILVGTVKLEQFRLFAAFFGAFAFTGRNDQPFFQKVADNFGNGGFA